MMNDTINAIFAAHPENEKVIGHLLNALVYEGVEVSPFIGAGMSVPLYPLWEQALKEMATQCHLSTENKEKIAEYLTTYQYELAASVFKEAIKGIRYVDALKNVFGTDRIDAEKLKNMPVTMLPKLFKGTIFTTNFERLLNHVYSCETQITMDSPNSKKAEVMRDRGHLHIVKIHGDIDEGRLIFTNEEYNKYYGENLDTPHVDYLRSLFASKIMLFLGCGLKEDRTFALLKKISDYNEYPHYALMEIKDNIDSDAFIERENVLSEANIRCIWYPKGQHQLVKVFLQYLIDHKGDPTKSRNIDGLLPDYYAAQRESLLQTNIVSMREGSKLKDVLPECYIDPTVRVNNTEDMPFSIFVAHNSLDGNVALLATPGMGKSTAFKAIIIKDYYKFFPNVLFYYIEAKDFILQILNAGKQDDIFVHIVKNRFPQFVPRDEMRIVLLIDSCDELSPRHRDILVKNIKKWFLPTRPDRAIWIGCRLDYYSRYYEKGFAEVVDSMAHICEWTPKESDAFIEAVLEKNKITECQITHIKRLISDLDRKNPNASFWRKNPFYLSLFLFCVIDQNVNEQTRIELKNAYELYGLFYAKWFDRHRIPQLTQKKIRNSHTHIALTLYSQKGDSHRLSDLLPYGKVEAFHKERAFIDLLRMNAGPNEKKGNVIGELKVDRFWHESFGEYLIAADLVGFLQNPPARKVINKEDSHLSSIVNYDVNSFIKDAFHSFSSETAIDICGKLVALYFQLQIESNEAHLKERWNLLYYIGRLNATTVTDRKRLVQMQKVVLINALNYETDDRVKRTAIISLMNIYEKDERDIEDKIVDYLSTLTPGSKADITNRSIQLVYCGDKGYNEDKNLSVEFGDLTNFEDKNKISWDRTKHYIFNRLVKDDRVSLIYRLWDLRTLYLFFESRDWKPLCLEDYSIVYKTKIDDQDAFSERIQKLLAEEKSRLLETMKSNLDHPNADEALL